MATCLSFAIYPLQVNASEAKTSPSLVISKSTESIEAEKGLVRLYEIDAIDKSNLNNSEKKNLRVEVRSIQHRLRILGGGVFISAGAIILIVVLLVILL